MVKLLCNIVGHKPPEGLLTSMVVRFSQLKLQIGTPFRGNSVIYVLIFEHITQPRSSSTLHNKVPRTMTHPFGDGTNI